MAQALPRVISPALPSDSIQGNAAGAAWGPGRRIYQERQRGRPSRIHPRKALPVKLFAEMFTIGPGNKDHHPALRCAVGVFVPLITLVLTGRLDLAIFASFGAFTGIYGRGELHRKRFFIQVRAGALMLLVILLATLTARFVHAGSLSQEAGIWLQVLATTLVAGGCSLVIARWRHRPAGSLFHIFAFAAIASIPNQPPLWQCMLVSVLTTLFCLAVGLSSRVLRSHRTPWEMPPP